MSPCFTQAREQFKPERIGARDSRDVNDQVLAVKNRFSCFPSPLQLLNRMATKIAPKNEPKSISSIVLVHFHGRITIEDDRAPIVRQTPIFSSRPGMPLRANIDETVLPVIINEQGENRSQCEDQRNLIGFPHGFARRGT